MLVASSAYRGTARLRETSEGRALLQEPPKRLVSVGVSAAAAAIERRRLQEVAARENGIVRVESADVFPARVLETLKRRRLPYEAEDVELLLDLGASTMRPDRALARSFESLSFGVAAARHLLVAEPGAPTVIAALERAAAAVEELGSGVNGNAESVRRRIRALLAANVPGGLLDLSIIDPRDGWAELASEALRSESETWSGTQELLALLAAATRPRPTKAWRRTSAGLAASNPGYGDLLFRLLTPLLTIELTSSGVPWPPRWLLAPQNEVLARGAAWATADVDEPWVTPLLARLALRCAAPSPHPTVTTALSHAVASGAVEALASIGTAPARDELRMLLGEIRRRDLLKRIAAIVGEPVGETLARDERVRREKRRAVRQNVDPAAKERKRAASAFVRHHLAPALRRAGFDDSAGRTFWRSLDDRVELLHCKAHRGGLTLELGIWFRFVPRLHAVPKQEGRPRPGQVHCDVRGNVQAGHDDLSSAGRTSGLWFAGWRPLPVVAPAAPRRDGIGEGVRLGAARLAPAPGHHRVRGARGGRSPHGAQGAPPRGARLPRGARAPARRAACRRDARVGGMGRAAAGGRRRDLISASRGPSPPDRCSVHTPNRSPALRGYVRPQGHASVETTDAVIENRGFHASRADGDALRRAPLLGLRVPAARAGRGRDRWGGPRPRAVHPDGEADRAWAPEPLTPHLRGRSAAKGSVIARWRSRKRKTSAGRPPARPDGRRSPVGSITARRSSTRLQVRRRHLVAERGDVDLAQLGERERRRREREAGVRVGELAAKALARREDDLAVVEGGGGQVLDRMPAGVVRHVRVEAELDEAEVGGRELPCRGSRSWSLVGRELLEVGDLADVHLRREVAPDRRLERLAGLEQPAGERPGAAERVAGALPEQRLERAVAHLQHDREGGVTRSGRLGHEFTTHSQKLPEIRSHEHETTAVPTSRRRGGRGRGRGARRGLRRRRRGHRRRRPTTDTTATPALKVGLVADAGQLNDNGFNELAYKGLKRAERELGITGASSRRRRQRTTSRTCRPSRGRASTWSSASASRRATRSRLPRSGSRTRSFAIVDVDQASLKGKPENVQGLLFREEQVGYLVGYLGALEAKRAGGKSVSAVGGFKEPPVDRFIAGYRAGALAAVPGTKVAWGYSQDWEDQAKCKELALNQIAAGSKVVFQVAGGCGLGALSAAKDEGVWGIGVDGDQSFLGPHVLTSALKGVDSAVFLTIKALQDGTFVGGKNIVFGIDQEGVGLGKLSPKANAKDVAAVEEVEQQLAAGDITGIPTTVK